jgi:hypothetical protein
MNNKFRYSERDSYLSARSPISISVDSDENNSEMQRKIIEKLHFHNNNNK